MSGIWSDVVLGARSLRRAAGASAAALVTLALGIAGTTVMFSMLKAWVLEPLPFANPASLLDVRNLDTVSGNFGAINVADFLDYRSAQSLDGLAGYVLDDVRLTGGDRAERLRAARVTPNFFPLLGAHAALGRIFGPDAGEPGAPAVAILSHGVWRDRFNADASIIGRAVRLDGEPHTIVGVVPRDFQFTLLGRVGVWRPMIFTPEETASRRLRSVIGLGHLREGRTVDQARSELAAIAQRLATTYPDTNGRRSVRTLALADEVRRHHDAGLLVPVLFAMMACVLLIACVNVTNVMLARASVRRHEMAVRLALGASKARIIRQWLVEHLLLFVAAGAIGAALSVYGTDWITSSIPFESRAFLRNEGVLPVDLFVLAFALGVSAFCALFFGWLPAWTGAKADVNVDLRDSSGRSATTGRSGTRARGALVACEVALALGLLISSALLVETTRNILKVDLGFDARNVLTFKVSLDEHQYTTPAARAAFYDRLLADLSTRPGVISAAAGWFVPFSNSGGYSEFFLEGQPETAPKDTPSAAFNRITPDYVKTMGLRRLAGRLLNTADVADAPTVALINETMARQYYAKVNPLGQRVRIGRTSKDLWTIVGIVHDVKVSENTDPPAPQIYVPFAQRPSGDMVVVLRTASNPEAFLPAVRAAVAAIDPAEPVSSAFTMDALVGLVTAPYRIISQFVGFFGVLTLLLAAVGVYGVLAYTFVQRTREIGIRMALGATRKDVARLVLDQLRTLVLLGLAPGLALAWVLANALRAFLFGVTPTDWSVYVSMSLALIVVALFAAIFPARRAASIEPLVALRYE